MKTEGSLDRTRPEIVVASAGVKGGAAPLFRPREKPSVSDAKNRQG
ncbi:MAG: hypothetical protein HYR88_03105 [Verrucomicrobia bacterium]|nr:hypothetical protein [Verrucomicrobiota bacterium]MBI3870877.1 hypothetical protein [Verrucomicrobiota bacterium]